MREVVCDEKSCVLEPSHQNQIGRGGVNMKNQMSGGSGGLAPTESTYFIPFKPGAKKAASKKQTKRSQIGGRIKKRRSKKRGSHSKAKRQRRTKQQTGGAKRRRKCVKRKSK